MKGIGKTPTLCKNRKGWATREITFRTLLAWHKEMHKCEAVDQRNSDKYHITGHDALAVMFLRQYHFMERHSLTDKFYAEDDGGKR